MKKIHKIKSTKVVKEAFFDENIECLRDACDSIRDQVIVELLTSTGVRVNELINLNKEQQVRINQDKIHFKTYKRM